MIPLRSYSRRTTKPLKIESLEDRQMLAVLQPGDANQDFRFEPADFVQVFKLAKFESAEPASWAEGDWNGGPGFDGPSVGDSKFDGHDFVAAFSAGFFGFGPYDSAASARINELRPLTQDGDADVTIVYDQSNGAMRIDSHFLLTTLNIESTNGLFNGRTPNDFQGIFDVGNRRDLFYLNPSGFDSVALGIITSPGLSEGELLDDLLVDGSRIRGGGLGDVQLDVCNNCVAGSVNTKLGREIPRNLEIESPLLLDPIGTIHPGDANLDSYFDQADLVHALASGKFESGEAASWAEGDWNGGSKSLTPSVGDGLFDQADFDAARATGKYRIGAYAEGAGAPSHGRVSLVQNDNADVTLTYDSKDGGMIIASTVELSSLSLASNVEWFSAFVFSNGPAISDFEVADSNELFIMRPNGFITVALGNVAPTGLTADDLLSSLTIEGSRLRGGNLGEVNLEVCHDCVTSSQFVQANVDDMTFVDITVTYDDATGELLIEAPIPFQTMQITSDAAIFNGSRPTILSGIFDRSTDRLIFKIDPSGIREMNLGVITSAGFSASQIGGDLEFSGSFLGGGEVGNVRVVTCSDCVPDAIDEPDEVDGPEGFIAGDANRDFFFDESDFVRAHKGGKFENGQVATWQQGDWNGDGVFTSTDYVVAFQTGRYRTGAYNLTLAQDPEHTRVGLVPGDEGDVVLTYDPINGDVKIEGSETISTLHIFSADGLLSLENPGTGLFDVSTDKSRFYLDPSGLAITEIPGLLPAGLTYTQVIVDLTVDGSFVDGGGLGRVVLSCPNCLQDPVPAVAGDMSFDSIVDDSDIDILAAEIRNGSQSITYDVNEDGNVDYDDIAHLVFGILDTSFGDANLDGIFDSQDLVIMFQAAKFENPLAEAAGWADGDWNSDGLVRTSDLVLAFQAGKFSVAANPLDTRKIMASFDEEPKLAETKHAVEKLMNVTDLAIARAADLVMDGFDDENDNRSVDNFFGSVFSEEQDWETLL